MDTIQVEQSMSNVQKKMTPEEAIAVLNKISGYEHIENTNVNNNSSSDEENDIVYHTRPEDSKKFKFKIVQNPQLFVIKNDSSISDIAKYKPPYGWERVFKQSEAEFTAIDEYLLKDEAEHGMCLPLRKDIFNAFHFTPLSKVKVVIFGQDPYHGLYNGLPVAHGLSFSVDYGTPIPESLNNIFQELQRDPYVRGFRKPDHGNLIHWAKQGVLLLNTCLTVRKGEPGSHGSIWMGFINKVISAIMKVNKKTIFLLWGREAQKLIPQLGNSKILETSHPSGYSFKQGFYGCGHFSLINEQLRAMRQIPIDWTLQSASSVTLVSDSDPDPEGCV